MYFVPLYSLHVHCASIDLDSSGSPGVRPAPGLTSSTQVVYVCVRANTNTHPPTTLTPAKNRETYKTNPLSLPLSKYSLPRQQQMLTMNKLKKNPTSNSPTHMLADVQNKPVIHTHVVKGLDSTNKQNAPTRVHMYNHVSVHIHVCAYTYTNTRIYIYIHMQMHIYTHTCAHIYI